MSRNPSYAGSVNMLLMKAPENRKYTANPAVAATMEGSTAFQVMMPFSRVVSMKRRAPAKGDVRNAPKKPLMAASDERVTIGSGMRAFSAIAVPAAPAETVSGASGPRGAPQTSDTSPRKKSSTPRFRANLPSLLNPIKSSAMMAISPLK